MIIIQNIHLTWNLFNVNENEESAGIFQSRKLINGSKIFIVIREISVSGIFYHRLKIEF